MTVSNAWSLTRAGWLWPCIPTWNGEAIGLIGINTLKSLAVISTGTGRNPAAEANLLIGEVRSNSNEAPTQRRSFLTAAERRMALPPIW